MKQEIPLSKKQASYLIIVFVSFGVAALVFFVRNTIRHSEEVKEFVKRDVKGKIINLDDLSSGTYSIEISHEGTSYKTPSLPIAWEVEKYNIKVGDSVSKEANSKFIIVYKFNNSIYERRCVLELR